MGNAHILQTELCTGGHKIKVLIYTEHQTVKPPLQAYVQQRRKGHLSDLVGGIIGCCWKAHAFWLQAQNKVLLAPKMTRSIFT